MDLSVYITPLRRWWWLLVAATVVAALSSFVVVQQQPPVYRSRTTLMIGRTLEDPNPTSGQFYLAQQLAATYAEIANREPVQVATREALGLQWLPEYQARALPNSQLIEIAVTDTNPARAQAVADELARQLVQRSPANTSLEEQERQAFINQQLNVLETQIQSTQVEIGELQQQLGALTSASQIADTQSRIQELTDQLNELQGNYANLLSNTQRGAFNILNVIEPANLPARPVGPRASLSVLLAAAVGLSLAVVAAYVLEYLDKTIKGEADVERILTVPRLGSIPSIPKDNSPWTYVAEQPRSPIADQFRTLRTNIDFISVDEPLRTILVTSADMAEGKSTIASNLALIMAQSEKRVVLVDADLRRPMLHTALNIPNHHGLSDYFLGRTPLNEILLPWGRPSIMVIPSGPLPPNPTELLGSQRMSTLLDELMEVFDVVILDGPPFLVADAPVVANKMNGVLVVIQPGLTERRVVRVMAEQMKRIRTKVVGYVLNQVAQHRGYSSSYYYYHQAVPSEREQESLPGEPGPTAAAIPESNP